jgi:hypothetical protein
MQKTFNYNFTPPPPSLSLDTKTIISFKQISYVSFFLNTQFMHFFFLLFCPFKPGSLWGPRGWFWTWNKRQSKANKPLYTVPSPGFVLLLFCLYSVKMFFFSECACVLPQYLPKFLYFTWCLLIKVAPSSLLPPPKNVITVIYYL